MSYFTITYMYTTVKTPKKITTYIVNFMHMAQWSVIQTLWWGYYDHNKRTWLINIQYMLTIIIIVNIY